jgi:hypothetical protein
MRLIKFIILSILILIGVNILLGNNKEYKEKEEK